MSKDEFGDRIKGYEAQGRFCYDETVPLVVRIDGRGFSKYTKKMKFRRPYDPVMTQAMIDTTSYLVEQTNADIGYTQSDEITLIFDGIEPESNSQRMFGSRDDKVKSVFASMATAKFISIMGPDHLPHFDCRAFEVPSRKEAANTLLWRMVDASKNSISMTAHHYFGHKQLQGKSSSEMLAMIEPEDRAGYLTHEAFRFGTLLQRKLFWVDASQLDIPEQFRPEGMVQRSHVASLENWTPHWEIANLEQVIFEKEYPKKRADMYVSDRVFDGVRKRSPEQSQKDRERIERAMNKGFK